MVSIPSLLLCIGYYCYKVHKKIYMDLQKDLFGWLEEATLFSTEPISLDLSLNDPLTDLSIKAGQSKEDLSLFTDVSDILDDNDYSWMQEKLDLSILDEECWLQVKEDLLNPGTNFSESVDFEKSLTEDVTPTLDDFIDENFTVSNVSLPSQVNEEKMNESIAFEKASESSDLIVVERDTFSPSSVGNSVADGGDLFIVGSNISSPSPAGKEFESISSDECYSPSSNDGNSSDASETSSFVPEPECIVVVGAEEEVPAYQVKAVSSVRQSLKCSTRSAPYLKKECKRERKKVQNKEAAARYREKKREEDRVLCDEVGGLEAEQKILKEKHSHLAQEVNYLKSLLKELFQARGIKVEK